MKIYEGKYIIYEDVYGELCVPDYDSRWSVDFEKTREYVKKHIDNWLIENGYRAPSGNKIDDLPAVYIGSGLRLSNEIVYGNKNESEEEKAIESSIEEFKAKDISDVYCEFTIVERDTENDNSEVIWRFDINGEWHERDEKRGEGWHLSFPGDELPDAGKKYSVGDYVVMKGALEKETKIYVVGVRPGSRNDLPKDKRNSWENIYELAYIDDYGYVDHIHIPEYELEPYGGEVTIGLEILQKLYAGNVPNSKEYIKMLHRIELILPDAPTYRDFVKGENYEND